MTTSRNALAPLQAVKAWVDFGRPNSDAVDFNAFVTRRYNRRRVAQTLRRFFFVTAIRSSAGIMERLVVIVESETNLTKRIDLVHMAAEFTPGHSALRLPKTDAKSVQLALGSLSGG